MVGRITSVSFLPFKLYTYSLELTSTEYFTNNLPSTIERDKLLSKSLNKNLIILGSGDCSIRFRPHLNVSTVEIDLAIEIIHNSLKDMLN